MKWIKQGQAVVGSLTLTDGRRASVAIVGDRSNPKGASVVVPAPGSERLSTIPLREAIELLDVRGVIDVLCMQERLHGSAGLRPPELSGS